MRVRILLLPRVRVQRLTVSKYLHSVPVKYIQIALSIETMLDLSTLTIEDVTGRLRAVDERLEQATATKDSGKLLLTEEEWAARRNSGVASSSRGGDGKRRGKASLEKKKKIDPNAYRRCGKMGHWAKECQIASRRRRLRLIWRKLLLTEEEWAARMKEKKSREASSSRGGDGKRRGKASSEKKKKVDPNVCRCCGKMGHWVRDCPNHKQEKKAKAHLA